MSGTEKEEEGLEDMEVEEETGGKVEKAASSSRGAAALIEEEASESDDGEGEGEEEEGEEEGEGDMDGFLVGSDDEEGEKGKDGGGSGGDSGSDGSDDDSEEDVDELAEEDLEIAGLKARKKKRRLVKASKADGESTPAPAGMTEEELKAKLFGRTDLEDLEDEEVKDQEKASKAEAAVESEEEFDSQSSEEDEFRDFIDDTEVHKQRVVTDDMDDEQKRIAIEKEEERLRKARQKQKRKQRLKARTAGVSLATHKDLQGLWLDADDLVRRYEEMKISRIETGGLATRAADTEADKKIDPAILEANFFTNDDDQIRRTDIPERLQLAKLHSVQLSQSEFTEQCEWICDQLLGHNLFNIDENLYTDILDGGVTEVESPAGASELHRKLGRRFLSKAEENSQIAYDEIQQEVLKESLASVLRDIQQKHLEVPFVAMYRKEHCGPLLCLREEDKPSMLGSEDLYDLFEMGLSFSEENVMREKVRRWDLLWKVHELSKEWHSHFKRAQKRLEAYKNLQAAAQEAGELETVKGIEKDCMQLLQSKRFDYQVIDDADAKFKMYQSIMQNVDVKAAGVSKRPGKTQQLSHWRRNVPASFLKVLCLSPVQFAANIEAEAQEHKLEYPDVDPFEFVEKELPSGMSPQNVCDMAVKLMTVELSSETAVRRLVRTAYRDNARVFTEPAKKGSEIRDPMHKYCPVSSLDDKPLSSFKAAEWLYLVSAEREGLIRVTIKMPMDVLQEQVMSVFESLYMAPASSPVHKEWRNLRKKILQDAVYNYLLPMLKLEVKNALIQEAKGWVSQKLSDEMWKLLSVAPWKSEVSGDQGENTEKYIMSCVWGPAKDRSQGFSTTLVMLDTSGNLADFLEMPAFSGKLNWSDGTNIMSDVKSQAAAENVKRFIIAHKPQIIALGSGSVECVKLKNIMEIIVAEVLVNHTQEMKGAVESGDIPVILASQVIPHLWSGSEAALSELPQVPGSVKEAVALGRMFFDPLPVAASLFSNQNEVAGLNLHEAQQFLSVDEQLSALEQCLVTLVSQVGVDLNEAMLQTWKSYSLPFVAGLGSRKANILLEAIKKRGGYVDSRRQLSEILSPKVWENACALMRFQRDKMSYDGELLDCTRIHPDAYESVKKLAREIESEIDDDDEAVEALLDKAEHIKSYVVNKSIDKFHFKDYAEKHNANLKSLIDFAFELKSPFSDLRESWRMPGNMEEFLLASNEIRDMIKPGRLCNARVLYNRSLFDHQPREDDDPRGIKDLKIVELDCGILAILDAANNQPTGRNDNIRVRVLEIPTADETAKVKKKYFFKPARGKLKTIEVFSIIVGNSERALSDLDKWEDRYCTLAGYQKIQPDELTEEVMRPKKRKLVRRPIKHEKFQNYDYEQTKNYMEKCTSGDFLFRPSSGGVGKLSLTVKLTGKPMILLNEQIEEDKKAHEGRNTLSLGTPLRIKKSVNEEYEDLDEIVARFVEPLINKLDAVKAHPKFRRGTKAQVSEYLQAQVEKVKYKYAKAAFSLDEQHPGYVRLSYLKNKEGSRPSHERIGLSPDGYRFRGKEYSKLEKLYKVFIQHPDPKEDNARRDARKDGDRDYRDTRGGYSDSYRGERDYSRAQDYQASEAYGRGGGGYGQYQDYGYGGYNDQQASYGYGGQQGYDQQGYGYGAR